MVTPNFLLVALYLLQLAFAQKLDCEYAYGNWTDCINYSQSRTVACLCDGVSSDMSLCNSTLPVTQMDCECKWKWSRWTRCTAECGGGNTTRIPQCYCNDELTDDEKCDINFYFGRETVTCNVYECGDVPALNKLYWISQSVENWPIENDEFNCSKGFDPNDSPKGKTYYDILSDPSPSAHGHPEWYFLAKEWITASLNEANGVQFTTDAVKVIIQVGAMLDSCTGWSDEEIPQIYSLKEKLGRLNNNIGGLENVDSQLALLLGGNDDGHDEATSRISFILAIAIPLVALFLVALALGFVVFYVRQKTTVVVDKFESEDEDDALNPTPTAGSLGCPAPLDDPVPLSLGSPHDDSDTAENY